MLVKVRNGDRILFCGYKSASQAITEYRDYDIYYLVNELKDPHATNSKGAIDVSDRNFGKATWIFLEFDKELPKFDCEPSRVIQSSPGKYHVYWHVPELANLSLEVVKSYFKALSSHYGTDLTKPLQMLRLPGSYNQKYDNKPQVITISDEPFTYTLDQLFKNIPLEVVDKAVKKDKGDNPFEHWIINEYLLNKLNSDFPFPDSNRNNHLNKVSFLVINQWSALISRESLVGLLKDWASSNTTLPSGEINTTVDKFLDEARYPTKQFFEGDNKADFEHRKALSLCLKATIKALATYTNEEGKQVTDPLTSAAIKDWFMRQLLSDVGYSPRCNYFLDRSGKEIKPFKIATALEGWLIGSAIKEERRVYGYLEVNHIEPIAEYFANLRLPTKQLAEATLKELFTEVMGLSKIDYIQARKWIILAAKRGRYFLEEQVINPYCLLFMGEQGVGKSAFFEVLGGQWHYAYTESADSLLSRCRALTVSLDEYDRFSNKSQAELKVMIAEPTDTVRPKYGRSMLSLNRAYSWCGTTNSRSIIKDPTGSRRYLIVELPQKYRQPYDISYLKRNRDTIWASALALASDEPIEFDTGLISEIESIKEQYGATTHQEEILREWINNSIEGVLPYRPNTAYSYSDVASIISPGKLNPAEKGHLIDVLVKLGWKRGSGWRDGKKHNWMISPCLSRELESIKPTSEVVESVL